jgi:hypothetical protein
LKTHSDGGVEKDVHPLPEDVDGTVLFWGFSADLGRGLVRPEALKAWVA